MNRETAIDLLDNLLGMVEDNHDSDYDAALHMGIDALQSNAPNVLSVLDCVERQAAVDAIDKHIHTFDAIDRNYLDGLRTAMSFLKEVPSVQPESTIGQLNADDQSTKTDVISRSAAIDALRRAEALTRAFGYHNVIETIRELPSVQPQRWIPVTEKLPEDACQCIVTAKVKHVDNYPDYEVDTADFVDGIFTTANSWWGVESIIAWMPLPEPYKE